MTAWAINAKGATGHAGATLLHFGATAFSIATTNPRWLLIWRGSNTVGASDTSRMLLPRAGSINSLVVKQGSAYASANGTFTAYVNGVVTTLTCVNSAGGTQASDTTHTVSITQFDSVSVGVSLSVGDTSIVDMRASLRFT